MPSTEFPLSAHTRGKDTFEGESRCASGESCTCEVDMRDVSCRPVRSEDDMLTGAPRWSRMLTFRSRSMPDTCRGDVFAGEHTQKTNTIIFWGEHFQQGEKNTSYTAAACVSWWENVVMETPTGQT